MKRSKRKPWRVAARQGWSIEIGVSRMQDQRSADVQAVEAGRVRKPFRVAQVAAMLDVHQATVYRDIEAGRLKALRVGSGKGALRIMPEALAAYFALLEVRAPAEVA